MDMVEKYEFGVTKYFSTNLRLIPDHAYCFFNVRLIVLTFYASDW